jgi:hypothetical protein
MFIEIFFALTFTNHYNKKNCFTYVILICKYINKSVYIIPKKNTHTKNNLIKLKKKEQLYKPSIHYQY